MATTPSFVQINEGTGKKLAYATYTENAQVVYDQKIIPGEPYLAHYSIVAASVSVATSASHMLQIMAGASLNVRIRRITATQNAVPAAVTLIELQLVRLTTAGTGGGVLTPGKFDNADAAAGATAMTLPTVKGTEGVILVGETLQLGTAAIPTMRNRLEWVQYPGAKGIIIPAGAANGLAIKNTSALAAAAMEITVEFTETSF